ncbi:MAG: trypsin-like peptidase domain-containing protein [Acidobacteriota bacterium]
MRSAGASALRLRITGFDLPKGAALYLYNDAGQAHGPYLGRGPHGSGEFWSNTVFGDTAWVQLHVAPGFAARGRLPLAFEIEKISHLGADFQLPALMAADKADCSANLDCVENAECYDWPELSAARRGVAYLNFEDESNGRTYGCTGGLLNDKDGSDRTPWLLTAAHCIDSEAEADSLEAFFQFQSDCGSCSGSSVDTVLGADLWATGSASDFSLLELSELPSSWFLMGWTNATILDNDGEVLYRISHPKGSPQSVSTHQVEGTGVTGNYILTENIFGTTEGQSSGSPIIRANRQVVGQLRGTTFPNQNLYDLCDSSTFTTRDGALSTYWKSVRPYLASPGNTYKMHVDDVRASVAPFSAFELARATVTVVDERGNGIPRVTVAGSFSGDVSGPSLGVTDDRGQALILYPTPPFGTPSFSFCVTGLSHDYFNTYDSAANAATCASR